MRLKRWIKPRSDLLYKSHTCKFSLVGTACRCEIFIMNKTHGMKYHPLYKRWKNMKSRCQITKWHKYKSYMWKWISVCERWNWFPNFVEDMYSLYSEWLELDRINNDWNYCPENCRWVTKSENCKNRWKTIPLPLPPQ